VIRRCSCGFATDDDDWLDGHLFDNPAHEERARLPAMLPSAVPAG
jgi:hypothetical protein